MRAGIIGAGEIGKSLFRVLSKKHKVYIKDKEEAIWPEIDVLNICYPYFKGFEEETAKNISIYNPKITIIHSTVPVGTTREVGRFVAHSPCHGKHPNLEKGIKTFVKYVGAHDSKTLSLALRFLRQAGIKAKAVTSPEASELSKLLCTTYYGWNIVYMKEVHQLCEEMNLPFEEVYTNWNKYYNEGYTKLGMKQFVRPVLKFMPGQIGGHCVVPNTNLLATFVTDVVAYKDEEYKEVKNVRRKARRVHAKH